MTNLHRVNEISKMIKRYENAQAEWSRRVFEHTNAFVRIHEVSKALARQLGIPNNEAFNNTTGLTIHPAITNHANYKKANNNYKKATRNMKNMYRIAMLSRRNNLARRLGLINPTPNQLRRAINNWKSKVPSLVFFARALTAMGPIPAGKNTRHLSENEIRMITKRFL